MQIHVVDSSFRLVEIRFMTMSVVRKFRIFCLADFFVDGAAAWGPSKHGHETDFYKAKRRIDDMSLHKKTRRIQLE